MPYLITSFFLYSFIGWLWESGPCSIVTQKKLVNRGFLNGPYCPIYGMGAILFWTTLRYITNPFLLFFGGMMVALVMEYITSVVMEKAFKARWWDYSDMPLNINGRVCAYGALIFGIGSLLYIRWIHPFVIGLLLYIPARVMTVVAALLVIVFVFDIVVSSCSMVDLNASLERIAALVTSKGKWYMDNNIFLGKAKDVLTIMQGRNHAFRRNQKRLLIAFPKMKSIPYTGLIGRIKQLLADNRNKAQEEEDEEEHE